MLTIPVSTLKIPAPIAAQALSAPPAKILTSCCIPYFSAKSGCKIPVWPLESINFGK